jgi:hypothetical protein
VADRFRQPFGHPMCAGDRQNPLATAPAAVREQLAPTGSIYSLLSSPPLDSLPPPLLLYSLPPLLLYPLPPLLL